MLGVPLTGVYPEMPVWRNDVVLFPLELDDVAGLQLVADEVVELGGLEPVRFESSHVED